MALGSLSKWPRRRSDTTCAGEGAPLRAGQPQGGAPLPEPGRDCGDVFRRRAAAGTDEGTPLVAQPNGMDGERVRHDVPDK